MEHENEISKDELVRDLRALGVQDGDLLHLKVSLKAVGPIACGPRALVDALLEVVGSTGTIVSDAFIRSYPLPLSEGNALAISHEKTPSYAGALANEMISHPAMVRSRHPIQKFAAIGRFARELCERHTADSEAYDLLQRMSQLGGKNLKIGDDRVVVGVGTTHVAVALLGYQKKIMPKGVNYRDENGHVRLFRVNWSGGCGRGFNNFLPLYAERGAVLATGRVGNAESKLTDMRKTLEIELDVLRQDPTFFLCDDPWCFSCRATWPFSDGRLSSRLLRLVRPVAWKLASINAVRDLRGRLSGKKKGKSGTR
jgi:aminoglycoside 3-N-acetyltransferase